MRLSRDRIARSPEVAEKAPRNVPPQIWLCCAGSNYEWRVQPILCLSRFPLRSTHWLTTAQPAESCQALQATRPSRPRCRSEEHTSELQSHVNLVCRLLLEKKKKIKILFFLLRKKKRLK